MFRLGYVLQILGLSFAAHAYAASSSIKGSVETGAGAEIAADDYFVAWADSCQRKSKPDAALELREKDAKYEPHALVAEVGQTLRIRNADTIRHNSFSNKPVEFDSGLQKPDTAYELKLAKPGVAHLFCRIHSTMSADVLVLSHPCFVEMKGKDALASFSIPNVGVGQTKVWLWSPRLKSFLSKPAKVTAKGGEAAFKIAKEDLLEPVKQETSKAFTPSDY